MRTTRISLCLLPAFAVLTLVACRPAEESNPPPALAPIAASTDVPPQVPTGASTDPNAPSLDLLVTKSMLYSAGIKHGVNPYLVMVLAWHEAGWTPTAT